MKPRHSSNVSLGTLLRQLKCDLSSGNTPSSRSSCSSSVVLFTQASSTALREETYNELHSLYKEFDTGHISRQQFVQSLKEEFAVNLTPDFERVVTDSNLTYQGMLKSLGFSTRRVIVSDKAYYDNPHVATLHKSHQRTTLPASTDIKSTELNNCIKEFACGNIETRDFQRFLNDRNIPITDELNRAIRERDVSNSAPFQKLAKAIYNSMQSSPENSIPHPRLNYSPVHKADKSTRYKASKELLKQELDTVVTGVTLNHRRKVQPKIR